MAWRINLTATATKQLAKLDKGEAKRIAQFLRLRLSVLEAPLSIGKALSGPVLGTYWRYRVGDYRIICAIQDDALCILVIELGKRSEVYR